MLVLLNGLQGANRSGTGTYTTELARWLPVVAEGTNLDVAVVWPDGMPSPQFDSPVREAFIKRRLRGTLGRIWYDQTGFLTDATRLGANITHFPANVGSLRARRNVVLTVHDVSFLVNPAWFRRGRSLYYRHGVRMSIKHAARIIAVSHVTARELVERLRVPEDRIDVIHNGIQERFRPVPEAERAAVRAKYNLPYRFLLFLGTVEPRKNVERIVHAFSRIVGECEPHLVIAGRRGWKCDSVFSAIDASPARDRIHVPGFIASADLPALMTAAEGFVWPSLYEGFGIPNIEAMACDTPVLTSNVSSIPEVVGDAALMVDPYDVDAIANGMYRLCTEGALRARLREAGLRQAAKYSWRRTAEHTLETYRRVLGI